MFRVWKKLSGSVKKSKPETYSIATLAVELEALTVFGAFLFFRRAISTNRDLNRVLQC